MKGHKVKTILLFKKVGHFAGFKQLNFNVSSSYFKFQEKRNE